MKSIILNTEEKRQRLLEYLRQAPLSRPLLIKLAWYKPNRTLAQNALLHLWLGVIVKHWNMTTGELFSQEAFKEFLKKQFLGTEIIELPCGQVMERTIRTRDLNTKKFTEFLEAVEIWAATEIELMLPRPDEYYFSAMGLNEAS